MKNAPDFALGDKRKFALSTLAELYAKRLEDVKACLVASGINPDFNADDIAAAKAFCESFDGSPDAHKAMFNLNKAFFAEMLLIQATDRAPTGKE